MGCFHPGSQVAPWVQLDTLDRSPFGHKTLFTFAKTAGPKQAANRRRIIGVPKTVPSGSLEHPAPPADRLSRSTHSPLNTGASKLVEADGIEPTTSSLQS